jgi:hypothetical protein
MRLEASGIGYGNFSGCGTGHSPGQGLNDCTCDVPDWEYHWKDCCGLACGTSDGYGASDCTGEDGVTPVKFPFDLSQVPRFLD